MTREDFFARIKSVGFHCWAYSGEELLTLFWQRIPVEGKATKICVFENKDMFMEQGYGNILYSFDELEQFLIDKRIVEEECSHTVRHYNARNQECCGICKKVLAFDAHEYLLSKNYKVCDFYARKYWVKGEYSKVYLEQTWNKILVVKNDSVIWGNELTKHSIDKAIKLVDFLIGMEGE